MVVGVDCDDVRAGLGAGPDRRGPGPASGPLGLAAAAGCPVAAGGDQAGAATDADLAVEHLPARPVAGSRSSHRVGCRVDCRVSSTRRCPGPDPVVLDLAGRRRRPGQLWRLALPAPAAAMARRCRCPWTAPGELVPRGLPSPRLAAATAAVATGRRAGSGGGGFPETGRRAAREPGGQRQGAARTRAASRAGPRAPQGSAGRVGLPDAAALLLVPPRGLVGQTTADNAARALL